MKHLKTTAVTVAAILLLALNTAMVVQMVKIGRTISVVQAETEWVSAFAREPIKPLIRELVLPVAQHCKNAHDCWGLFEGPTASPDHSTEPLLVRLSDAPKEQYVIVSAVRSYSRGGIAIDQPRLVIYYFGPLGNAIRVDEYDNVSYRYGSSSTYWTAPTEDPERASSIRSNALRVLLTERFST